MTLFAKSCSTACPIPGPALGNLAYDAAHKQLFVSDLYTGMIHRFAVADGSEPGAPYDHGVTGRGAANLPPMPFNPANRPNIANNKFSAENPDSWGLAPPRASGVGPRGPGRTAVLFRSGTAIQRKGRKSGRSASRKTAVLRPMRASRSTLLRSPGRIRYPTSRSRKPAP